MRYTELFARKQKEWDKLIKFASRRYQIPGVLDSNDLYQEGLIILNRMFEKYDFDPDSDDFRKMFKTELWHGLSNVLHRHKTKKRDWRVVDSMDFSDLESPSEESPTSTVFDRARFFYTSNPEIEYAEKESSELVARFISALEERLDGEAVLILHELLHPPSWDEIPDVYKETKDEWAYERVPRRIPQHVIAGMLGVPLIRVRRAIKRIRRTALSVSAEVGFGPTA